MPECLLEDIVQFTKATVYFRWYCSCGAVGGKRGSRDAAFESHKQHASNNPTT